MSIETGLDGTVESTAVKKVLVVDDEPEIVTVLEVRLKANGYDVITGYCGEEALRLVKEQKPDLIILDVMMPQMSGYKVCGLLKGDTRYQKIPVIMLTARAQDSDRETAQDVGADAYLTKPIDSPVLLSKMKELLAG